MFLLNENEISFPNPQYQTDDNEPLAIGGDLSVERLLLAYQNGIFPWYSNPNPILWWCPKKRFIIRPQNIHISHSARKFLKKNSINIKINDDFAKTMHYCRTQRENNVGTWITDEMEKAYYNLHKEGFAVSVDSYINGELSGGLYGVSIGRCFFGESMYSLRENGSKMALILLCEMLTKSNFDMIDCQFHTPFLESMGGEYISYDEYMEIIAASLKE